jgi:hypothetical protein
MKSFAENINQNNVMISGLKSNQERAAKRGFGSDAVSAMETDINDAKILNNEQETLKAKLQTKTEELNKKMEKIDKQYNEAKKVVKLEFDKSQWKEFGIDDKR